MLAINCLFTRAKCGGGISRSEVNGTFYQGDLLGVCVVGVYIEFSTGNLNIAIGQVYNEWHIWFFGNFQVRFYINAYFPSVTGKFKREPQSGYCIQPNLRTVGQGRSEEHTYELQSLMRT